MTNRENYLSIARRTGYDYMPVSFSMCPDLSRRFSEYTASHPVKIHTGEGYIGDLPAKCADPEVFMRYYKGKDFREGTRIDGWGVAHEPGSAAAFHMTRMHHPMEDFDSAEQIMAYPLPVYDPSGLDSQRKQVRLLHEADRAAMGGMQCTIWETAWYMRGMENLMCDMKSEDPMAEALLDRVADLAVLRASSYAKAGADAIFLGDDIGTQSTLMMSEGMYAEWLKPRLKRVIDAARDINPEIIVFYHSCGYVTEFIPHLIKAGIDVLNPVQPECMDFRELHGRYGDRLSFHGTIGTQSVMPFGTPEEVRRTEFDNLDAAGEKGGLYVCPTHLLEPEVPVENVIAYINACAEYRK